MATTAILPQCRLPAVAASFISPAGRKTCSNSSTWIVQRRSFSRLPFLTADVQLYKTKLKALGPLEAAAIAAHEAVASSLRDEDSLAAPLGVSGDAPTQKFKRGIGALQKVPAVAPPEEQLQSALKRASRVVGSSSIRNDADKERNRAARQMDTLMKELSRPLTRYLDTFPSPTTLHPFEQALLDLTVGNAQYLSTLNKVKNLRKNVQEAGKSYAGRANNANSKKEATALAQEGAQTLSRMWNKSCKPVSELKEIGKKLRHLPYVDPALPTLALVGAPNVGKSSLVKILSSGTPEVCNYPFTTRNIKMGHFYVAGRPHQVTDTPGLLDREDQYRNKMELLTLATLTHLPTAVLHVMDLTEDCGTSVEHQFSIRSYLKERYPDKLWLDVFTKADLLGDVFHEADNCITRGTAVKIDQDVKPATPAQVAALLPQALRVSSVTQAGIDDLKMAIMNGFLQQTFDMVGPTGA